MTTTAASPSRRFTGDFRADVLVAVLVITALLAAYIYQLSLQARTTPVIDQNSGFALSIPNNWTVEEEPLADTFVSAYDSRVASVYKSTVAGRSFAIDPDNPAALEDIVNRLIDQHGQELPSYHLLDSQATTVAGAKAWAINYAYVAQPIDDPFMAAPPVVVIATDYVIYTNIEYWLITLTADEKVVDKEKRDFDRIIGSIDLP